jgi:hypothetical protein
VKETGGLAQLARAPALQAGGHRFDSDILHGSYRDVRKNNQSKHLKKDLRQVNESNPVGIWDLLPRCRYRSRYIRDKPFLVVIFGIIQTKEFIDILVKE